MVDVQDREHLVGHMILYRLDNVTSVLNLSLLARGPRHSPKGSIQKYITWLLSSGDISKVGYRKKTTHLLWYKSETEDSHTAARPLFFRILGSLILDRLPHLLSSIS